MKVCLVLIMCAVAPSFGAELSRIHLANPLQGTDSHHGYSHGNEYPAIALPFPMNTWAPYTQPANDSFYYQYRQNKLRGIRQTHQPSPWIGDYAAFSLMPVSGKLAVNENDRASEFRHQEEVAEPSYYRVRLDTWKCTAEVTPTVRCARFRFTFEDAADAYVVLDAFPGNSAVEVSAAEQKITGVSRFNHGGVPDHFANYFVIVFDQPFQAHGTWTPEKAQPGQSRLEAKHAGAFVKFAPVAGQAIECKVASSFISPEQALRNLEQEIGGANFEAIRQRAEKTWNDSLNRARVEGGLADQQRTFYSALYRSIVYPHRLHEYNEQGKPVYFSPYDGKLHEGVLYTDTGFWDTFRAAHPLYNLLFPEVSAEILQSLLRSYDESGWLPSWSSPGHRDCMIGNHAFATKLDAVFSSPSTFNVGTYGSVIHEMTEMAALDMGQYAHGNEPIHHMVYLYNYAGQPWKTQSRVRLIMSRLYQATPDGLCGDEDTGQMSAWLVFSALGFYPVCPGTTVYDIGSPLFRTATLNLAGSKTFVISAANNGPQRQYIRGATLNGQPFARTYLRHDDIINGGEIAFDMTSAQDYKWATGPEARPLSPVQQLRSKTEN